ncbi:hypothetical protein F132_42 [Flavobacterium sp. phage 1/32]|nr:hypothetical protein F132_42 [Flavobacterium sp. phage 1/32]
MSVKILKREYGNAFAPSSEAKPDWLIGNVGDWLRLNMEVEAGIDFLATQQEPITINKEERTIKLMNGKKWGDYGFDLGASLTLTYKISTYDGNGVLIGTETVLINLVIEQLYNDTIVYASNIEMDVVPYENLPTDRGSVRVFSVKLFDDRDIQGLRLKYANIENSEAQNHTLTSFIDGTETEAIYVGLNNITAGSGWQNMQLIGLQSGMSINSAKVRKIGANNSPIYEQFFNPSQPTLRLNCQRLSPFNSTPRIIREAWATPTYTNPSPQPSFQPVTGNNYKVPVSTSGSNLGNYSNGTANRCFYYNAPNSNAKQFDLEYKFRVTATNKNDANCYIRLVLIKYKNGTALNFAGAEELKRWNNNEFPLGVDLVYNDTIIKNINAGESFCLAIEWNHVANNTTQRYINVNLIRTACNVYDLQDGFQSYKKKYEIEVDFMLSSFWEEIVDLENLDPPNTVFNANSLTDSIKLLFYPEWNNPNVSISNNMIETERLGNTGWFNENYNGLPNDFQVKEISYTDLGGQTVTGLSYGGEVKVRAKIGGVANLSSDSDFKYGFIWLPTEEDQYKEKQTPFHVNTKVNNHFSTTAFNPNTNYPFTYLGFGENNALMNVRNVFFQIQGNDLIFEAIFTPTIEFKQFFDDRIDDRKYAIWLSVADRTLVTNFSDRVSLLLDVNDMDYFIPISGVLPEVTNRFLEHPEDHLAVGVENYNGFLEDDVLGRAFFPLENGKRLANIILGYEVENLTTGATYELERFTANLQTFITNVSGVQEIDFNSERGFKYVPNFNKNWVKIIRDASSDSQTKAGYQILFGTKIRWENWLQRTNVPVEFYDNSLPYNGSTNNWLDYLRAGNNHKINFFILFDVVEAGQILRYKNTFKIDFNGYDENTNIETTHEYFDNETNNLLNVGLDTETGRPLGVLLSNKNTRIEITYKKLNGDWDLGNVYAVTTLEIDKGAGEMEHRQLSSIIESEYDNILIPLADSTKLKVQLIAPDTIKTSCLVDYTRLETAIKYKITGRIGCFRNDNGIGLSERIYDENNYENKYE